MAKKDRPSGADYIKSKGLTSVQVPFTSEQSQTLRRVAAMAGARSKAEFSQAVLAKVMQDVIRMVATGKTPEQIQTALGVKFGGKS